MTMRECQIAMLGLKGIPAKRGGIEKYMESGGYECVQKFSLQKGLRGEAVLIVKLFSMSIPIEKDCNARRRNPRNVVKF